MYLLEKELKRFWSKVDIKNKNECWEWQAGYSSTGYGAIRINGYMETAHRVALANTKGFKNEKNYVLHKCDNSKCVNPNHLYEGTPSDNMIDLLNRHPDNYNKGKLNSEAVKVIKWMLKHRNYPGLQIKLARLHKVHRSTISAIKRNKHWTYVKI